MPAEKFIARLGELRAARDEIKGRERAPDFVAETPTGITIRQYWATLDAASKRRYLIDAGMRVYAASGQQTYLVYDDVRVAESANAL